MWTCRKCRETVEDSFEACWSCGTTKEGVEDRAFRRVSDGAPPEREPDPDPISCPRCAQPLQYVGTKRLHEGTNWGVFGELGELFVKREHFDVYVCPRCGRVEFFVDGIGDQFRPH